MAWTISFDKPAARELDKIDPAVSKRILKFLFERVSVLENPRSLGQALRGPVLGKYWKYRVGDYRLICKIEDETLHILVVKLGNRREIYTRF